MNQSLYGINYEVMKLRYWNTIHNLFRNILFKLFGDKHVECLTAALALEADTTRNLSLRLGTFWGILAKGEWLLNNGGMHKKQLSFQGSFCFLQVIVFCLRKADCSWKQQQRTYTKDQMAPLFPFHLLSEMISDFMNL